MQARQETKKMFENTDEFTQFDFDIVYNLYNKLGVENILDIPDYIENGRTITGTIIKMPKQDNEYAWKMLNQEGEEQDWLRTFITKCLKLLRVRTKEQLRSVLEQYNYALLYSDLHPSNFDVTISIRNKFDARYEDNTKDELEQVRQRSIVSRARRIHLSFKLESYIANSIQRHKLENIGKSNIALCQIYYYNESKYSFIIGVLPVCPKSGYQLKSNSNSIIQSKSFNKCLYEIHDQLQYYYSTPAISKIIKDKFKTDKTRTFFYRPITIQLIKKGDFEYYRQSTMLEVNRYEEFIHQ